MRRLPQSRQLSSLLQSEDDLHDDMTAIARVLVEFDSIALRSAEIDQAATRDAIADGWQKNFAEVRQFVGRILDPEIEQDIQERVNNFLAGRADLFEWRISQHAIRDGHGDLQADDIYCLDDGPKILDCIEFDATLRYVDSTADLSFLVMDLERLGRQDTAQLLIGAYQELSGERIIPVLLAQYCAARAYIRCKVACLAHEEGDATAAARARQFHALALTFARRCEVRLVLVGGLPGTGKSTLAAALADELGAVVLRSDEIRKELAPNSPWADQVEATLYSPEMTATTYRELIDRARIMLRNGQSVVLDASWNVSSFRALAAKEAQASSSKLVEFRCVAPERIAARRIVSRNAQGTDVSDATPDVARHMRSQAEPWPSAVIINTSGTRQHSLRQSLRAIDNA